MYRVAVDRMKSYNSDTTKYISLYQLHKALIKAFFTMVYDISTGPRQYDPHDHLNVISSCSNALKKWEMLPMLFTLFKQNKQLKTMVRGTFFDNVLR